MSGFCRFCSSCCLFALGGIVRFADEIQTCQFGHVNRNGVLFSVTRLLYSSEDPFCEFAVTSVLFIVCVENDLILAALGHAETVSGHIHAREAYDRDHFVSCLVTADKRNHILVCIVGSKPFKAVPRILNFIQRRRCGIEMIEFIDQKGEFSVRCLT